MVCSRGRRLAPVLALLVLAGGAAFAPPQARDELREATSRHDAALQATSAAAEAVLPLKLEQPGDRLGHPGGTKQRLPLAMAVVAVDLLLLAVAFRARHRSTARALPASWFVVPPSRGPPAPQLLAT